MSGMPVAALGPLQTHRSYTPLTSAPVIGSLVILLLRGGAAEATAGETAAHVRYRHGSCLYHGYP